MRYGVVQVEGGPYVLARDYDLLAQELAEARIENAALRQDLASHSPHLAPSDTRCRKCGSYHHEGQTECR